MSPNLETYQSRILGAVTLVLVNFPTTCLPHALRAPASTVYIVPPLPRAPCGTCLSIEAD